MGSRWLSGPASISAAKSGSIVAVDCSESDAMISDSLRRLGSAGRRTATGCALRSITISVPDRTPSSMEAVFPASSASLISTTPISSILRLSALAFLTLRKYYRVVIIFGRSDKLRPSPDRRLDALVAVHRLLRCSRSRARFLRRADLLRIRRRPEGSFVVATALRTAPPPSAFARRRDEFLGILLVAAGLLLLAALVSYHPNDPSLFSDVNDQGLRAGNWAGRFGATFADGSLQFFGLAALVAPLALLALGWRRFLSRQVGAWGTKGLGVALVVLALAPLAHLALGRPRAFGGGLDAGGLDRK